MKRGRRIAPRRHFCSWQLLDAFKGLKSLHGLLGTKRLEKIARGLPRDPALYEALLVEMFEYVPVCIVTDWVRGPSGGWRERKSRRRQAAVAGPDFWRALEILRVLLFHDGRSFRALLSVADRAVRDAAYAELAVNPLAGIPGYLIEPRRVGLTRASLLRRFKRYSKLPDLRQNALLARSRVIRWPRR